MRKLLLGFGMAILVLAMASSASAATFKCNEVVTGGTYTNVAVPVNGSCTMIDSTVLGDVSVTTGGYFQASNTDISGKVKSYNAQTLFIDSETTVGRDIKSGRTAQVFIYNAQVERGIFADDGTEITQICGNTVTAGGIHVTDSGPDILVGDPLADCSGNTVNGGDLEVSRNFADVEFVVRGNTVSTKNLEVIKNLGSAEKAVEDNTGGKQVNCRNNEAPFAATGNNGWSKGRTGQCKVLLTCDEVLSDADVDDVSVPVGGACTLINSRVSGNAIALDNAYLQATNTAIGGKVRATRSQTLFLDSESTVGLDVQADRTVQVFLYNATIGHGLAINRATEVVQLCGNTVTKGSVTVADSGTDVLIGAPTEDCAGNTIATGNMSLKRNFTDVEFVVHGNSLPLGSLTIQKNKGPAEKSVQDNSGGGTLDCVGNADPFAAAGNTFPTVTGQCVEV